MGCDGARWRFAHSPDRVYTLAKEGCAAVLPAAAAADLGAALAKRGYKVFLDRQGGRDDGSGGGGARGGHSLYAFKGLAGRLGPIGVHASMLAVMAGGFAPTARCARACSVRMHARLLPERCHAPHEHPDEKVQP